MNCDQTAASRPTDRDANLAWESVLTRVTLCYMGIGVPETGIPVPFSFFACVGKVVTTGNIQVIYVDIVLYTASRAVSVF